MYADCRLSENEKMKKILLLAYSYPPLEDAQSLRWYYLSNELAKLGYKIDVLTIEHPAELTYPIHKNITIHRVYAGFFETTAYRLKNKMGVDKSTNQERRGTFSFALMKKTYWFFRTTLGAILPGNIATEWYPFAKKYIDKHLQMKEYDYLLTSHEPWVDSLLGLSIKKNYPNLEWIADFADPYVSIYTPEYKLFFENRIEKKIYRAVDKMIVTNQKVREKLEQKYSFLQKKDILVLEQGFKKREHITSDTKNDIFTLLYTGTFYEDFRNPKQLAKALSALDFDFNFIVAGRNEQFNDLFQPLGDKYQFLGFVSHNEVLELQENADVLVHLSNKQIEQVPGKFFEYLGTNKSLLVIYQNHKDQLKDLCEELEIKSVCPNDHHEIKKTLTTLYQSKGKDPSYNRTAIQRYSWENRAKLLKDFIVGEKKL
jgi:glycosyltransferase involved in cell wall biosynthesis